MILPTMTGSEMVAEMMKDRDWLLQISDHKTKEHRRDFIKSRRYPMAHVFDRISPKTNQHYVVAIRCDSRPTFPLSNVVVRAMAIVKDDKGRTWGVGLRRVEQEPILYTHHFFDRYAERHLKRTIRNYDDRLSIMAQYACWNTEGLTLNPAVYKHHNCYERTTKEGLELLQLHDGLYEAHTFINGKMLNGRQHDNRIKDSLCIAQMNIATDDMRVMRDTLKFNDYYDHNQRKSFGGLDIPVPVSMANVPAERLPTYKALLKKMETFPKVSDSKLNDKKKKQ